MKYAAILFDFDGVLLESEYAGNLHIAEYLTSIGHVTSAEDSMANFMGLAGAEFIDAIERWIGRPLPESFHPIRAEENLRVLREGLSEVAGASAFLRHLPDDLPRAITSSSSTEWIETHLVHLAIRDIFGPHIYSGREHVTRGKPEPDIYLYAAKQLGVPIEQCVILEDSPVGVQGALRSGADVIGLCAGAHCGIGHAARLRAMGVKKIAHDFDQVASLLA